MPTFFEFTTLLISSAGLAGLIGMEREMKIQNSDEKKYPKGSFAGGLRSHAMVGGLGFLLFFIHIHLDNTLTIPLSIGVISIFTIVHFLIGSHLKQFGMTSSFSFFASFCIGIFVANNNILMALVISLLFTSILVLRDIFHKLGKQITQEEFFDIIKFLILSFVVLQILPSSWIDPLGFFDWKPQSIWLMVMLVASIRFIGYFLSKFIGREKGILLSGIVGGLVSSTAVTSSIAQESKSSKRGIVFVIPILVASSIMFFRVIIEIIIVSENTSRFLPLYASFGTMGIACLLFGIGLFIGKKQTKIQTSTESISISQPLHLGSAISFGMFFLFILIVSEKISEYLHEESLLIVGAIAGLTDVDAITLAMAQSDNTSFLPLAVIFVAVIVNTLVKIGIVAVFGSRPVLILLSWILGIILCLGGGVFFMFI
jgi:uncharacterized membrane protein (DUF4010 family)